MAKDKRKFGRAQRYVELAEAHMLGHEPPAKKERFCISVPGSERALMRAFSDEKLRTIALELGCYKGHRPLLGQPLTLVAQKIVTSLRYLTLQNAPCTTVGLLQLGEWRVRHLVQLLLLAGCDNDNFCVRRRGDDIPFKYLVTRVLLGLKKHDHLTNNFFHTRSRVATPDMLGPEPAEPTPSIDARTRRLFARRLEKHYDNAQRISNNMTNARGRGHRFLSRLKFVEDRLRCGCLVNRTVPDARGRFMVGATFQRCSMHPEPPNGPGAPFPRGNRLYFSVLHVRDLMRTPKKRRAMRDKHARGRPWRQAR